MALALPPAGAAGNDAAPLRDSAPTSKRSEPGEPERDHPPTAEDVLRALQRERPPNDVIPPASAAGTDRPAPKHALWPEGASIVSRLGEARLDGEWWVGTFEGEKNAPAETFRLLPNAALEVMIRTMAGSTEPMRFVLSGEITVFHSENYVLVRMAMRAAIPKGPAEPQPAPRGSGPPPNREVSPEDVVAILQAEKPTRALMSPTGDLPDERDTTRPRWRQTVFPDGSALVNRAGRLVRQGSWWVFVADSEHPDRAEPALRLLPNQVTDMMIRDTETEHLGLTFLVSGEITAFAGENYLLPRTMTRRLVTDNLRK